MRHVEPNGESPKAFMESLFDLGDAYFEEIFSEDPALNELSNNVAQTFCNAVVVALDGGPLAWSQATLSTLHFAIKKAVFVFTDPKNHNDTLSMKDIAMFFQIFKEAELIPIPNATRWWSRAINRLIDAHKKKVRAITVTGMSRGITLIQAAYREDAQADTGPAWDTLSQSDRFKRSIEKLLVDVATW